MNDTKLERRIVTRNVEVRAGADGKPTMLRGYAAVFNSDSEDLGGFTEQIAPGAFTDTLAATPDCRCLFNHDPSALLGRTSSGTLRLRQDSTGLFYECEIPDTTLGRDILTLAQRGDISQSSFGFTVAAESWYDANGNPSNSSVGVKRIIRKVGALLDVSPVTYPAYPESSVQARDAFLFPDGAPQRGGQAEAARNVSLKIVTEKIRKETQRKLAQRHIDLIRKSL